MTPMYAGADENKHGNNGSGEEYSSALTASQDAEMWVFDAIHQLFRTILITGPERLC